MKLHIEWMNQSMQTSALLQIDLPYVCNPQYFVTVENDVEYILLIVAHAADKSAYQYYPLLKTWIRSIDH
jgi:hypothetical protein